MKFNYFIQQISDNGLAIIEYSNKEFGSSIKNMYLPIHKSPEYIEKFIIRNTPRLEFQARQNRKNGGDLTWLPLEGSFETSLEDNWYETRISPRIKKELVKFPDFLVWIFKMQKGDYKFLNHVEATRNLELPKHLNPIDENKPIHPLYPIGIFVKGSFLLQRESKTRTVYAGSQETFEYIDVQNGDNVSIMALEDDSEYHCLTPRCEIPKFFQRKIMTLEPGTYTWDDKKWLYIAKGHIVFEGKDCKNRSLIKSTKGIFDVKSLSIVAEVWE